MVPIAPDSPRGGLLWTKSRVSIRCAGRRVWRLVRRRWSIRGICRNVPNCGAHPVVTESKLKERSLSRIRVRGTVRLVNLAESGALTRIGADARIFTAGYTVSQRWSRAIHEHPDQPDGILYRPRHDPARVAAAFFDRIAERVTAETLGTWVDQKPVLPDVLDTYGVALIS